MAAARRTTPANLLKVDPEAPEGEAIALAAALLRAGRLVAFPTETVYGLGANALDEAAVALVFEAKGRPAYNPLIVHVAGVEQARELVTEWPAEAELLARRFWPGPLTIVLPKRPLVPDVVTAGLPTVALRVPAHPVALALIRAAGVPVAAPSANRFTEVSPTTAQHVADSLGGSVDLILDGGPTDVGIESTVVSLAARPPLLLRKGRITRQDLEEVIGPVEVARATAGAEARPGPGMLERHYSPKAELWLLDGPRRTRALERARRALEAGERVGALTLGEELPGQEVVKMPTEPAAYARRLYAALRRLDARGCRLILVEPPPEGPAWEGVRDRLERASAKST